MCTAPPLLRVGFNATVINTTDDLRLTCIFSGNPLPMIEWYFKGEQLPEATTIIVENRTGIFLGSEEEGIGSGESQSMYEEEYLLETTSTLVIPQVTIENEGTYICNATNGVPNLIGSVTSHNSVVDVQGK